MMTMPAMRDCGGCGDTVALENLNDGMECPDCSGEKCPDCGSTDVKEGAAANPRDVMDYGCRVCGNGWMGSV